MSVNVEIPGALVDIHAGLHRLDVMDKRLRCDPLIDADLIVWLKSSIAGDAERTLAERPMHPQGEEITKLFKLSQGIVGRPLPKGVIGDDGHPLLPAQQASIGHVPGRRIALPYCIARTHRQPKVCTGV